MPETERFRFLLGFVPDCSWSAFAVLVKATLATLSTSDHRSRDRARCPSTASVSAGREGKSLVLSLDCRTWWFLS